MTEVDGVTATAPTSGDGVQLKRELGLFSAVNMILGIIIGSGIFISASSALEHAGSIGMCLIVWTASGVISLLGALAFVELGAVVPRSGGEYAYCMEAFGPLHPFWGTLPAFLSSWVNVIVLYPAGVAVSFLTFAEYICRPIFNIVGLQDSDYKGNVKHLVAFLALGIITYVNIRSVKLYAQIQNVFSFFKLAVCVLIIVVGMYQLYEGNVENISKGFEGTNTSPKHIVLAFYSGLWAYCGWSSVVSVTEEVKSPEVYAISMVNICDITINFTPTFSNILRSIIISLPIITILFVLINLSYMTVLSVPEMVNAPAVAVSLGEKVLGPLQYIIPIGVALSTFGGALIAQFSCSRLCYVAGQDGHMIECLSYVHYKNLTPVPALLMHGCLTAIYLSVGNVIVLIELISFLVWLGVGAAMVALLLLRKSHKEVDRPYRVPTWIPIISTFIAILLSVIPIVTDPTPKYFFCLGFLLFGVFLYYCFVYKKWRPQFMDKINHVVQLLCEVVPSTIYQIK